MFAVLLSSSFCFAENAPVAAPGDQAKVTENKTQEAAAKPVKSKAKKHGKKVQKKKRSKVKKETAS